MTVVADLGGRPDMGPVKVEQNEPVFHEDWERRMYALCLATLATGYFCTDEIRRAVEEIPEDEYFRASYYERWLKAVQAMLIEKDVLTREEVDTGHSQRDEGNRLPPLPKEAALFAMTHPMRADLDIDLPPRFAVGDAVVTRNTDPAHHTRLPHYARGKKAVIESIQGVFLLPDSRAHGGPDQPQRVYTVRFEARELWGDAAPHGDAVYLDMFDEYLEQWRDGDS